MFEGNDLIPHREGRLVVAETAMWIMECIDKHEYHKGFGKTLSKEQMTEGVNDFIEAIIVETHRRINNHFRDKKNV